LLGVGTRHFRAWDTTDCFTYLSLYETKTLREQVALPMSMYKHLSCAPFKIRLTTGSGNAGTCEKLNDKRPVFVQALLGWLPRNAAAVCEQLRGTVTSTRHHRPWAPVGSDLLHAFQLFKAFDVIRYRPA
jgi:hypothetical protein